MMNPFETIDQARTLALEIVNTIPDPFQVLDGEFRVLAASSAFYDTFKADPQLVMGSTLFALSEGRWDIPALRILLETIIPEHAAMDAFEVEHHFPNIGARVMLRNARLRGRHRQAARRFATDLLPVFSSRPQSGRGRVMPIRPQFKWLYPLDGPSSRP